MIKKQRVPQPPTCHKWQFQRNVSLQSVPWADSKCEQQMYVASCYTAKWRKVEYLCSGTWSKCPFSTVTKDRTVASFTVDVLQLPSFGGNISSEAWKAAEIPFNHKEVSERKHKADSPRWFGSPDLCVMMDEFKDKEFRLECKLFFTLALAVWPRLDLFFLRPTCPLSPEALKRHTLMYCRL